MPPLPLHRVSFRIILDQNPKKIARPRAGRRTHSDNHMKKPFRKFSLPYTLLGLANLVALVIMGLTGQTEAANVYKSIIRPNWAADHSHFWYRNDLPGGRREFVLVDLEKGVRRDAFDHDRLAKALSKADIGKIDPERLPIERLYFDAPNDLVLLRTKGRPFKWERKSGKLTKIEKEDFPKDPAPQGKPPKKEEKKQEKGYRPSRRVSPDGKWRAFVKNHNLFVRATEGGEEIRLSKDGTPDNGYEDPFWSPNSNNLISFRVQPATSSRPSSSTGSTSTSEPT